MRLIILSHLSLWYYKGRSMQNNNYLLPQICTESGQFTYFIWSFYNFYSIFLQQHLYQRASWKCFEKLFTKDLACVTRYFYICLKLNKLNRSTTHFLLKLSISLRLNHEKRQRFNFETVNRNFLRLVLVNIIFKWIYTNTYIP